MSFVIGVASHGLCALGFGVLTALLVFSRSGGWFRTSLALASGCTTAWALALALLPWFVMPPATYAFIELIRDITWLIVLDCLIRRAQGGVFDKATQWVLWITVAIASSLILYGQWFFLEQRTDELRRAAIALPTFAGVMLSIAGFILVEHLYRSAHRDSRWAFKYFCFGLGLIFAYDFLYYADSLLFRRTSVAMFDARGFINAMIVPFLAVAANRAENWEIDIHVSRKVVFHTFTLIGAGAYLLVMAAAGYYLREFGGDWGSILEIVVLAAGILGLIIVVSSGALRARFKVQINKHFFRYKYDYREEWLRFIAAMSSSSVDNSLHDRVIYAVSDLVHSNAGALWVLESEDNAYFPTGSWNFGEKLPAVAADSPVVRYLTQNGWVVDLSQFARDPSQYDGLQIPEWLANHHRAWLMVPLLHRDVLHGFLILGETRAEAELSWEDFDLLKTVGRQVASYLAEEMAVDTMVDALRLEAFNRRFAFVIHDIKNLTSQMSLMLQNAEKFGDRPDFQKDMIDTVRNSVTRMRALLEQLSVQRHSDTRASSAVPLTSVLAQTSDTWQKQKEDLDVDFVRSGAPVVVDGTRLSTVLDHLLQNAMEAVGDEGQIALRQFYDGRDVVLEVRDNGPGMDEAFVRDILFSPLNSKKKHGYGLGAYQTRQLVREMGGRLEVDSKLGHGTTMRIVLPDAADTRDPAVVTNEETAL